jgi:hypothetical protein
MRAPLLNKNLSAKTTMDPIKLSTCLFQGRMRESGSKMCKIKRLDGMPTKTRSSLFSDDTLKTQTFTKRIRPNE